MCDYKDVCKDYNPMCDADVGEEDIYPECFKPWPKSENGEASGSTEVVGYVVRKFIAVLPNGGIEQDEDVRVDGTGKIFIQNWVDSRDGKELRWQDAPKGTILKDT